MLLELLRLVGSKIQVENDRMDFGRNRSDEVKKVKEIKVKQEDIETDDDEKNDKYTVTGARPYNYRQI